MSGSDGVALGNDVVIAGVALPGSPVSVIFGQTGDSQDPTAGLAIGNVALNNDFQIQAVSGTRVSGVVSGSGSLTKSGNGTLLLEGANNYMGGTRIEEGELRVASNTALGTGKLTIIAGTLSGDAVHLSNALEMGSFSKTNLSVISLGQKGTPDSPTLLILNGATSIQQTTSITVPEQASVILAGTISGKGFTKEGPGNLYLQNAATNLAPNSYGGETVLKEGVLGITEKADFGNSTVQFQGGTLDLSDVPHHSLPNGTAVEEYDIAHIISAINAGNPAKFIGGTDSVHKTVFATGLSGLGGLELVSGTLQVAATNAYSGQTTVREGGRIVLPAASSLASSANIVIKGTIDGSADGFTFRPRQRVEIQNGGNNLGLLKIKDGTGDWANANLAVDIARRVGALGAGIAQTSVSVNGTSSAINGVTLKVIPPASYSVGAEEIESSTPVKLKDYFTAFDANDSQITDRSRIGPVSGNITSARPIYSVSTASGLASTRRSYSVFGNGTNGENFGAYLDKQISATSANPLSTFLRDTVDAMTESPQITQVLSEMSAVPFADAYRSGFQRSLAVLKGVEDRIMSLQSKGNDDVSTRKFGCKQVVPITVPISPSSPASPSPTSQAQSTWTAWSGVYGRNGRDKADNATGVSRATTNENGVQFGVEHEAGVLTLGLTGATGRGRRNTETPFTQISSESWHFGLYAVAPVERVVLDSSLIFGTATNQSSRTPHLSAITGNPDVTYHGEFDSRDLSILLGLSYNMMPPQTAFQASSVLRLIYLSYAQSSFSENEAEDGAYRLGKMKASKLLSKLGYQLNYTKNVAASTELEATLGAYWQHDWNSKSNGLDASLSEGPSGTSYQALGGKGGTDVATLNCGLQLIFNSRYWIRASGALERGGRQQSLTGTLIFGVNF